MIEYLPYGETLYDEAATVDKTEFRFTSKEQDAETGLYYHGARYRDAKTGVWLSCDPALSLYLVGKGSGGGIYNSINLNLYTYCGNDPINYIDPDGKLTVHIWLYRGKDVAWGHASLTLEDGTHISWWPEAENRNYLIEALDIYEVDAIKEQEFEDDMYLEGEGKEYVKPDCSIKIIGLDEKAIKEWWEEFSQSNTWKTLSQNCSTTVADALKNGGGDKYASFLKSHNFVWTPNSAKEYAESIKEGILNELIDSMTPGQPKVVDQSAGHEGMKHLDHVEDIYRDDEL